jgi:hypothetical protein
MKQFTTPAFLLTLVFSLGCASDKSKPDADPKKVISMPENPEADSRARLAVAVPLQILAERVELYLPPALYSELQCVTQEHSKDEYDTAFGRRITLVPPQAAKAQNPARVSIGEWKLAARGKIDVLFSVTPGEPAARVRAFGVDLLYRDKQSRRGLPAVEVDDTEVRTPGTR